MQRDADTDYVELPSVGLHTRDLMDLEVIRDIGAKQEPLENDQFCRSPPRVHFKSAVPPTSPFQIYPLDVVVPCCTNHHHYVKDWKNIPYKYIIKSWSIMINLYIPSKCYFYGTFFPIRFKKKTLEPQDRDHLRNELRTFMDGGSPEKDLLRKFGGSDLLLWFELFF